MINLSRINIVSSLNGKLSISLYTPRNGKSSTPRVFSHPAQW